MSRIITILFLATFLLSSCSDQGGVASGSVIQQHNEAVEEASVGPHDGRMLVDGEFRLELAIFEDGVDPEFRAWARQGEKALSPGQYQLQVELSRLGDVVDHITFSPREDYLLGSRVVYEPHSFVVEVKATLNGTRHQWRYDSFEGRTQISTEAASVADISTDSAGPAVITETLTLQGTVVPDPGRVFRIRPRFPGVVKDIRFGIGDRVNKGDVLATIEANESLQSYQLLAPSSGEIISREVNAGEIVDGEKIMILADLSSVWVELAAFQHDLDHVKTGQSVTIRDADGHQGAVGIIQNIAPLGSPTSQSMTARVVLPNEDGYWRPGLFVSGEVTVASNEVALAVRREALQTYRDWTVAYLRDGDTYEVRPVTLGRRDSTWVEVLEGLQPNDEYVTTNSYMIKADIEKSGAKHDH